MSKARIEYPDGRYPYPAAAGALPGALVVRPDGTYAILDGLESCVTGERISPMPLKPGPTVIFQKSVAGDNITAGTVVYLIVATGLVTATEGSNIRMGKAIQAAGAGVTHVHVNPQA
jgi:hypothetical protein